MRKNILLLELWPLLFVLRLVGFSPLQPHRNCIQIRFLSYHTAYFIVVYGVQLLCGVWITYRSIQKIVNNIDPGLLLMSYAYLGGMILPILLPMLIALQAKQQASFLCAWYQLKINLDQLAVTQIPLKLGLRRKVVTFLVCIMIISVWTMSYRYLLMGTGPTIDDVLHLTGWFYAISMLVIWSAMCTSLRKISERIILEMKALQEYNETGTLTKYIERVLYKTRILWLQLAKLVMESGNTMSIALVVTLNFHCFSLLVLLNQLILHGIQSPVLFVFIMIIVSVTIIQIVVVCTVAHVTYEQITRNLLDAVQITKNIRVGAEAKLTVTNFLLFVYRNFPPITFSSYFYVGRGFLTTLVSVVVTNLIVLVQLNVNQKPISYEEFLTFGEMLAS